MEPECRIFFAGTWPGVTLAFLYVCNTVAGDRLRGAVQMVAVDRVATRVPRLERIVKDIRTRTLLDRNNFAVMPVFGVMAYEDERIFHVCLVNNQTVLVNRIHTVVGGQTVKIRAVFV